MLKLKLKVNVGRRFKAGDIVREADISPALLAELRAGDLVEDAPADAMPLSAEFEDGLSAEFVAARTEFVHALAVAKAAERKLVLLAQTGGAAAAVVFAETVRGWRIDRGMIDVWHEVMDVADAELDRREQQDDPGGDGAPGPAGGAEVIDPAAGLSPASDEEASAQGGEAASRLVHTQEIAGSTPAPAPNSEAPQPAPAGEAGAQAVDTVAASEAAGAGNAPAVDASEGGEPSSTDRAREEGGGAGEAGPAPVDPAEPAPAAAPAKRAKAKGRSS